MRSLLVALFLIGLPVSASAQAISLDALASTTVEQLFMQFLPSSYLNTLTPENTANTVIMRLEDMLKNSNFTVAIPALATTSTSTQTLITSLLAQVATLQAQIDAIRAARAASSTPMLPTITASSTASGCPIVTRLLTYGTTGADVEHLQSFLISKNLLEAGSVTGFFGKLTEAAVQAWQSAQAIVTEGDPETTGFGAIGPKTRAALQNCL